MQIASSYELFIPEVTDIMDKPIHHFSDLFAQLGLPNDAHSIAHFLSVHASMADCTRLPDALYWTPSQAAFLRESLSQDSDWAGLVDQLSKALSDPEQFRQRCLSSDFAATSRPKD